MANESLAHTNQDLFPGFRHAKSQSEPFHPHSPQNHDFTRHQSSPRFKSATQPKFGQSILARNHCFAFRAPSMVSSKTSKMPTSSLSSSEFRKTLGHFTTGVTVVTVEPEPGKIHGMTANSFTSVSLDPMLILVCVDHRAIMYSLLQKKKQFGVSVLKH